jgi:ElaB/YqjD/DUF883 family membrane-anchored ribosome-binding protein
MENATKEKLMTDVNTVLADAEELLRQAAQATGEQAAELRRRAQSAISKAKIKLIDAEHRAVEQAKTAAKATDNWVHDHPWSAVGIAGAIGVLLGLMINRR